MSDDKKIREKQVFVRNLPFDFGNDDLLKLFDEIGPIKHVSVATDSNKKSKGFGFVTFSLPEDAVTALNTLNGKDIHGRKIKLELAIRSNHKTETQTSSHHETISEPIKETPTSIPEKTSKRKRADFDKVTMNETEIVEETDRNGNIASENQNPQEIKTRSSLQLIVMGVPAHVDKKSFKRTLSKISRKAYANLIKQDHELSSTLAVLHPPGRIYLVTAPSKVEVSKVLSKLNNAQTTVFERKPISQSPDAPDLAMKGRVVVRGLSDIPTDSKHQKSNCRVIIRNLSFHATEENVLSKMGGSYGPVREVSIPKVTIVSSKSNPKHRKRSNQDNDSEGKLKSRGFAFVTFLCKSDAEKAVKESGKLKICNREVAVDFCASKYAFSKQATEEELAAGESAPGALIAVKNDIADEEDSEEEENENESENDDDNKDLDNDGNNENADSDGEGDNDSEDVDENAMDEIEDDNEDEDEEKVSKPKNKAVSDVEEGCTVFVRGLPFDTESKDLYNAFKKFGRVKLALLVKDKDTDAPKGTAFIKFADASMASACIEESGQTDGVLVKDRHCRVDAAVGRERAQLLTSQQKVSKDKRNLYLANEGLLYKSHNNEHDLPASEQEKRQRAQADKKKKLQNPLYFVSPTRLSIRNLAKNITSSDLATLCSGALYRALDKKLVSLQDAETQLIAQGLSKIEISEKLPNQKALLLPTVGKVVKGGEKPIKVLRSSKVMMDLDKVRGGTPVSRGFGFVEFNHHVHALAVLRELSSNPNYKPYREASMSSKTPLMVDFTLENVRKVKILEERALKNQQSAPLTKINAKPKGPDESTDAVEEDNEVDAAADSNDDEGIEEEDEAQEADVQVSKRQRKEPKKESKKPEINSRELSKKTLEKKENKQKQAAMKRKDKVAKRKAKKAALIAAKITTAKKNIPHRSAKPSNVQKPVPSSLSPKASQKKSKQDISKPRQSHKKAKK